jgi:hypothetical protein
MMEGVPQANFKSVGRCSFLPVLKPEQGGGAELKRKSLRRAQDSNLYGLAPSGFQDRRLTS